MKCYSLTCFVKWSVSLALYSKNHHQYPSPFNSIHYIIGIWEWAVLYFSDTLPSKSPILIIMHHLELTPECYKLIILGIFQRWYDQWAWTWGLEELFGRVSQKLLAGIYWVVQWFISVIHYLVSKFHLEPTPESYKLIKWFIVFFL